MAENENEQDAGLGFEIPESALADDGDDEPGASDDETTEGGGDGFGEDDEQPETPGQPDDGNDHITPEQLEARAKRTETSFKTYARAVERNYEDDFQYLAECILCPDQHKGFLDVRSAGFVPQEIQDSVNMYFGITREQNYELDTDYTECPKCKGKGKVALPTHVAGKDTMECRRCGGRGYLPPADAAPSNGHVETGPMVYGLEPPVTQAFDEVDEWDEPRILPDGRENPNFGKMPNRKIPVEPWGQTAGLNALSA